MKRAQTEIMGLLVIFILFIFIGLIYFRFSGTPEEEPMSTSRSYIEGSNMVSAMMSYSICPDSSFHDALKTCIENEGQVCGMDSCEAVKKTAEGIVKAVMGNETYKFTLIAADKELVRLPAADIKCVNPVVNTFNNTLVRGSYMRITLCRKGAAGAR